MVYTKIPYTIWNMYVKQADAMSLKLEYTPEHFNLPTVIP